MGDGHSREHPEDLLRVLGMKPSISVEKSDIWWMVESLEAEDTQSLYLIADRIEDTTLPVLSSHAVSEFLKRYCAWRSTRKVEWK